MALPQLRMEWDGCFTIGTRAGFRGRGIDPILAEKFGLETINDAAPIG
jgi:hypothetical protein